MYHDFVCLFKRDNTYGKIMGGVNKYGTSTKTNVCPDPVWKPVRTEPRGAAPAARRGSWGPYMYQ